MTDIPFRGSFAPTPARPPDITFRFDPLGDPKLNPSTATNTQTTWGAVLPTKQPTPLDYIVLVYDGTRFDAYTLTETDIDDWLTRCQHYGVKRFVKGYWWGPTVDPTYRNRYEKGDAVLIEGRVVNVEMEATWKRVR